MISSIIINVPFEYVVGYAGNQKNFNQWSPTFTELKLVYGELNKPGSKYECHHFMAGLDMLTKTEIVEVNSKPDLFVVTNKSCWSDPSMGKEYRDKEIFKAVKKDNTTEVTYELDFEDSFKEYPRYDLACMMTQNELEFNLKNLKLMLENYK